MTASRSSMVVVDPEETDLGEALYDPAGQVDESR